MKERTTWWKVIKPPCTFTKTLAVKYRLSSPILNFLVFHSVEKGWWKTQSAEIHMNYVTYLTKEKTA